MRISTRISISLILAAACSGQAMFFGGNVSAGAPAITFGSATSGLGFNPTVTLTITSITAGSTIFASYVYPTSGSSITLADDRDGAYTQIDTVTLAFQTGYSFYVKNASSGTHVLTFTVGGGVSLASAVAAVEIKGASTTAPLRSGGNKTGSATSGSSITSASLSSTSGDAVVSAVGNFYALTWTAGTPTGTAVIANTSQGASAANTLVQGLITSGNYTGTSSITSSGSIYGVILTASFNP